jgi:DNA-directed RNA polymerase specialized sigma24 family protein
MFCRNRLLDAFNRLKDFRQETTFGLWLKQIVVHRSINLLRKRKLEFVEIEDGHLDNVPDEEPWDDEDIQYQVAQVKEAMKGIARRLPGGIIALPFRGIRPRRNRQVLNITENTSRTQFLRAKRKLSEILIRKGIRK